MNGMENIQKIMTEDSVTIYWDKPETMQSTENYKIFVNGNFYGETEKTHFTIKNLEEQTMYQIKISRVCENRHLGELLIEVVTERRRKYIDISKEPYCAVGDGQTLNTKRIQKAIDDCKRGEGIYIPAGIYMTGALKLHSDMELFLADGAVLQGTDKVEDYLPRIWSRFEGIEMECYSSLLNLGELDHNGGYSCRNVVIRGKGTIAGGGRRLAENVIMLEKERLKEYLLEIGEKIREYENEDTIPGRVRPRLINMSNAQNIRITGVTLKNGASWNVHMIYSDHIITDNCIFHSRNVWNGDGWDPDSSTNCTIFGCTFYTGDDAIAIKSGKNPEGNKINRPSENIRIFDCCCAFGHGIAIGSEMSGGISNVKIWDCDLSNSMYGIEIKGTKKRGGYVRNIQVNNCKVPRILFHSVGYNDDGVSALTPPIFEECRFENLTITGICLDENEESMKYCNAIELCGFDEKKYYIKNVQFKNIFILNQEEKSSCISMKNCEDISFINVSTDSSVSHENN